MAQPTHKNLQSTFAAPPPRGRKLQGLLKSPDRRQPAAANSEPDQQDPASPTSSITQSPDRQADAPSPDPTVAATPQQPAAAPIPEATNKVAGQSTPAGPAVPRAFKPPSGEIGPTSVYLRTKAYRELVDRRQRSFGATPRPSTTPSPSSAIRPTTSTKTPRPLWRSSSTSTTPPTRGSCRNRARLETVQSPLWRQRSPSNLKSGNGSKTKWPTSAPRTSHHFWRLFLSIFYSIPRPDPEGSEWGHSCGQHESGPARWRFDGRTTNSARPHLGCLRDVSADMS